MKTCIWTVNYAFYSHFTVYYGTLDVAAVLVFILFVQVLKKVFKSFKFELKSPAETLWFIESK